MTLFDDIQLPPGEVGRAVQLYFEAHDRKDFAAAAEFFHDDVLFNGLVLKANGRDEVAGGIESFARNALDWIRLEAITQPEAGDTSRVLALYWVKLRPAAEAQVVCDHMTFRDGRIARIDNVFDLGKVPAM
jgi:ketosteroid isomerase-like protein